MKKICIWFLLLQKRLLKKPLFLLILFMTPALVLGMRQVAGKKSGILTVFLYEAPAENGLRESTEYLIEPLMEKHGLVQYEITEDPEEAREKIARGEADALWIMPGNLKETISRFLEGKAKTVVTIACREETVYLTLAREQLYGYLYPLISKEAAWRFMSTMREFRKADKEEMRSYFEQYYIEDFIPNNLVRVAHLDNSEFQGIREGRNYLTTPLRGILALLVLFAGFAVTLFCLQDKERGLLSWLPIKNPQAYSLGYLLIGTGDAALAAYAALYLSGSFTTWQKELPLMVLYFLAVSGFCLLLSRILRNIWVYGATIPVWLLACIVLTPIFIDVSGFPLIQYLLPPYYYLNALHSDVMTVRMIFYAVIVCLVSLIPLPGQSRI